jgi:hypothetical protein
MIKLQGKSQIITHDETFKVTREGQVIIVDGKPVKKNLLTLKVKGNIQPVNGRDLLLVPEGDRFKEQYWIYYNNSSIIIDEGLEIETNPTSIIVNDRLSRLGGEYQVQSVENWGSFSRARIMRIDVGPYAATP